MKKELFNTAMAKRCVDLARDLHEVEGEVEIDRPLTDKDARAMVSAAGKDMRDVREAGGVYVKAWVWVPINEIENE